MTRESPPLPPPPPPSSFPIPFARQRSTDRTQHAADNSAYFQAGPPPGNYHSAPMPSASTHTSQLYTSHQPPQPPPIRHSTRPHPNVTAPPPAPTPRFTTEPAPPYEYVRPPPAPQMSGSTSHYSDPGPSIPARPPFTAIGTNASGSRPPQRLMTMPVPNTAAPVHYHSGSPPNIVYPPPQSEMTGGPPPNTQGSGWSYLDLQERDDVSSDSGDEDFAQSPDSTMSNSSAYLGQKGPTNPPYAGRRRRPKRRETAPAAPASSSQALPELEQCKLCHRLGPRHEWASLGHGGFCSERHKWQW
ncbi:hypothetical protein F5888DRAFT_1736739 [Russula emetica]|nr:hypothetical protein F5888DRAFT_1736739 [Russula emetica]